MPNPAEPSLPSSRTSPARSALIPCILAALCLALRLIHLRDLPIFGDEAIYLRWAQLIREGHPWVSLIDPKPPLHFWLIAAVFHATADPLVAARAISALAGAGAVPLFIATAAELAAFSKGASARSWGLLAALFAIFCPFLAFYQRLATADALFVTEALLAVWLSLRWARHAVTPGAVRSSWLWAVAVGIALGICLMTRQGLSYTLFAMPLAAWGAHALGKRGLPLLRPFLQLFAAGLIAGLCWLPFLTVQLHARALDGAQERRGAAAVLTNADLATELKRRIFFQDAIAGGGLPDSATVARNARVSFLPGWSPDGQPNSGWLCVYLTPAIFLFSLVGLTTLAGRGHRAVFVLLVWLLVMLLPVIVLGHSIFSRYLLAAVPPLLLAASYFFAAALQMLLALPGPRAVGGIAAAIVGCVTLVPAISDVTLQTADWSHQNLTVDGRGVRADRYQYLTGWTAGLATQGALRYLQERARAGPIVVITDNGWGTPADALWVYLSPDPNVQLYYTDDRVLRGISPPTAPASARANPEPAYLLKTDKFLFPKAQPVDFPRGLPVYYVLNDPVHADVDLPARVALAPMSANLGPSQTFYGIEGPKGEGVVIFPLFPGAHENP